MKVFVVLGVIVYCASAGYVDSNGWQSGGSASGWPSSGDGPSGGGGSLGWSSGGSSGPAKIIKIVEENHGHAQGAHGGYQGGGYDEEIVKIIRVQGGGHGVHSDAPPVKIIKVIDGSSAGGHGGYSGGHGDSGYGNSGKPQVIKVIKILGGAPGKNFVPDINNPWLMQGNAHGNPWPQNTNQNAWPSQNVWQ